MNNLSCLARRCLEAAGGCALGARATWRCRCWGSTCAPLSTAVLSARPGTSCSPVPGESSLRSWGLQRRSPAAGARRVWGSSCFRVPAPFARRAVSGAPEGSWGARPTGASSTPGGEELLSQPRKPVFVFWPRLMVPHPLL